MTRQVKEAIRILNRPGSLNSKDEFGRSGLTRLTVEQSEYVQKKEQIEQKRKEQEEEESWERFVEKKKSKDGKRKDDTAIEESYSKRRTVVPYDEVRKCENIPEGWRDGQTESNHVTKASGVIVKGGKGPPCMSVQDIAGYFK